MGITPEKVAEMNEGDRVIFRAQYVRDREGPRSELAGSYDLLDSLERTGLTDGVVYVASGIETSVEDPVLYQERPSVVFDALEGSAAIVDSPESEMGIPDSIEASYAHFQVAVDGEKIRVVATFFDLVET